LLDHHEWLIGEVAIDNMARDEASKGVCSPGTWNRYSVGGWSRPGDTSFRLFFQRPTIRLWAWHICKRRLKTPSRRFAG
jgi:hypothetical protein